MHPHPDRLYLLRTYRQHILSCKRKWKTARGLFHYRQFIDTYLWAKRLTTKRDGSINAQK